MPYNCLYLNKGNNSSVKRSILTKLIGYQESMVFIICTKNELNLTNRYWDMVPDRQKVRTDGWNGRTDAAKNISLRLRRGIITTYAHEQFVWFDSLRPSQQLFSYVGTGLPGLNQYEVRINVACSRKQHSDACEARTRGLSVSRQACYHRVTVLPCICTKIYV